ncbi:histone-lysine N-methyltransferase SETDB1 isoform X7 [Hydra vulgaris]|uniref:Histone-lysine N-methyltransferase SETDB1 isoform X7 n=1 Tax=Hydra vulgaris TaxID=6087 RepID=A0ABM4BBR5_HYDVU
MDPNIESELLNAISDDFLIKQYKDIVDQQIEAQGFPKLCKRTITKEVKDAVQKINNEHIEIKKLIQDVSRYQMFSSNKKTRKKEDNIQVKSSSNCSNNIVIVIDDDDDDESIYVPKTSTTTSSILLLNNNSNTLSVTTTSTCFVVRPPTHTLPQITSDAPAYISLLSPPPLAVNEELSKTVNYSEECLNNGQSLEHINFAETPSTNISKNIAENIITTLCNSTACSYAEIAKDTENNNENCRNEQNKIENQIIDKEFELIKSSECPHAKDANFNNNKADIHSNKHESNFLDKENQGSSVVSGELLEEEKDEAVSNKKTLIVSNGEKASKNNFNLQFHKKSDFESVPSSPLSSSTSSEFGKSTISADSPASNALCVDIENYSSERSAPSSQDMHSSPDSQSSLKNEVKVEDSMFNYRDHSLVYARPDKSDIWYQAEIIKELSPFKKERRFQVHFLSGQKITQKILIRSLASIHSIDAASVKIGSRIVAPRPSDTVNSTISKKYKDISNSAGVISVMFAGIVAEVACEQNKFRYLIFFDDGYAQYLPLKKLFPVVFTSKDVWNDVSIDCREFIKEYLHEYPYRPLLNAKIGCAMQTEWNGSWWKSKVISIDGSLIKVLFDIDKRSEWVYKGTTRLEPLYNYFLNPKSLKNKSTASDWVIDKKITHPNFGICCYSLKDPKGEQQRLEWDIANEEQHYICEKKESNEKEEKALKLKLINLSTLKRCSSALSSSSESSNLSNHGVTKHNKKRKVITDTEESSPERNSASILSCQESVDASSALQLSPEQFTGVSLFESTVQASIAVSTPVTSTEHYLSTTLQTTLSSICPETLSNNTITSLNSLVLNKEDIYQNKEAENDSLYVQHTCSCACIKDKRSLFDQHRLGIYNYLSIPLQLGWKRESSKKRLNYHRDIYYRAPCCKRMRNLSEVSKYLALTNCKNVCIDMFCFQSNISCRNNTNKPKPNLLRIEDISNGKELCPVVCVNEISTDRPPHVIYINDRIKAEDVSINTDPGFLVCCDCTDNCQDKTTCRCAKLTIESSNAIDGEIDKNSGYHFRRLKECIATGIYECNQNCSCSRVTCYNRVVQNGIQLRLQVFLTENRGWGLRCIDDIPKGTFVCTYAGQVLNEQTANKEGIDFGDEYLAELDHIEVVEQAKDGYESDIPELSSQSDYLSSDEWQSDSSYSIVMISSDSDQSDHNESQLDITNKETRCENNNETKTDMKNGCGDSKKMTATNVTEVRQVAKKSTGAKAHAYMSHRGKFFMTQRLDAAGNNTHKYSDRLSTRHLYQNDNQMFILDAKSYGNVGRYMNHSCSPNLFVQNVMVDTHDLRFPWVAFFTLFNIPAYTELTWDYNYEVGSVPNKHLSCKCGSKQCKGRLL